MNVKRRIVPTKERTITITIIPPRKCTDAELEEWIKYELKDAVGIDPTNPLRGHNIVAESIKIH